MPTYANTLTSIRRRLSLLTRLAADVLVGDLASDGDNAAPERPERTAAPFIWRDGLSPHLRRDIGLERL